RSSLHCHATRSRCRSKRRSTERAAACRAASRLQLTATKTASPQRRPAALPRHTKLPPAEASRRGPASRLPCPPPQGEAINRIYQAVDEGFDVLVMNQAGFTYAGFALKHCIKGAGCKAQHLLRPVRCGRRNDYRLRDSLLHSGPRRDVRNPEKEDDGTLT